MEGAHDLPRAINFPFLHPCFHLQGRRNQEEKSSHRLIKGWFGRTMSSVSQSEEKPNLGKMVSDSANQNTMPMDLLYVVERMNKSSKESCLHFRDSILMEYAFGGVPVVFALNVVFWLIAIFIYAFLRKAAWDYGRLGLLADHNRTSLISMFFGEQTEKISPLEATLEEQGRDTGYFSWFFNTVLMKKEKLVRKCGDDAKIYLDFQIHLIFLFTFLCVPSLGVILPINYSGEILDPDTNFGSFTIVNVSKNYNILWVHSLFSFFYFLITFAFMTHHSQQIKPKESMMTKTLMITYIPKEISDPEIIMKHFHEAYPTCKVVGVYFCYDLQKLIELDNQRQYAMKGRLFYNLYHQTKGKKMIRVHPCSCICFCHFCKCFKEVDAEQYYSELEERLTDEFNAERSQVYQKRLDVAFVTFQSEKSTSVVLKDYKWSYCGKSPQQSSVTSEIQSHRWKVYYASHPKDIIWEHLRIRGFYWWARFLFINSCLFFLIFFLTTPSNIMTTIITLNVTRPIRNVKNPIINQFFSCVLLWACTVILPFIVYYSSFLEKHWTRSTQNLFTVFKCYFLLIFMVIILPSLGLTSLNVFFRWLFDSAFLDKAYVKFRLIGMGCELLRVESLLFYAIRLFFSQSEAERINIRQDQTIAFEYGREYSWICCVIGVVMSYSITCPIIVPFGLLYVCMKHITDKYNLYYAYAPTKLKEDFHLVGVYQVMVAPILAILWLLFFTMAHLGFHPITLFTLTILFISIMISFANVCFGKFWRKEPIYKEGEEFAEENLQRLFSRPFFMANLYVAPVLQEMEMSLTPATSPGRQSYGTMSSQLDALDVEEESGPQSFSSEVGTAQGEFQEGLLMEGKDCNN
ncbi:calcium permeable stress-gated cation channel 1 isoform X2 [Monodelphis domestica]|uniref:calcium permeable stress-gated cation channel 1 isoform X2 n=1 Tax=Monodelphis domestica TaxID=13616 RepID=UPI0007B413D0|nr:calcium permeable stress-gated cation channel 1 isoform X2 [Monodelphis domestica]